MDTTTGVIIFIFVVSILTSFGSNKGYTPPSPPPPPTGAVYSEVTGVEPDPTYFAVVGENARSSIENFILKYRSNDISYSIADSIMRHSQAYDMNPKLVTALIARESKFNPRALSSSGAAGLGQLLPSTARNLDITDPYDIDQNVKGTVRYFKSLIDRFKGKISSAIAAYLEGPNAVSQQGGFSSHTKAYVEDILSIYQRI